MEYEGASLSFGLEGAKINQFKKKVLPKLKDVDSFLDSNNAVMYQNVYPSIDLVYEADTYGLKEYIILNEPTNQNEFYFNLKLDGLTIKEDDGISFVNEKGETKLRVGQLYAFDSDEIVTEKVTCEVVSMNNESKLKLTLDREYLTNPERVFPIVIDPTFKTKTITGATDTFDAYVSSKYPSKNYQMSQYLRTGRDDSYYTRRTYIKFNIPTFIKAYSINSADLRIRKYSGAAPNIKAYQVRYSWSSSSITWNNKTDYFPIYYSNQFEHIENNWYQTNVKSIVNDWLDPEKNNMNNYGFLLKDMEETGNSQWTTFYSSDAPSPNKPELVINYIYCGEREYEQWAGGTGSANCMSYAFDETDFIGPVQIGISDNDKEGKNVQELLELFYNKTWSWTLDTRIGTVRKIDTYYSEIDMGWYRVVLTFHWWYQTNTGKWAEKKGEQTSSYVYPNVYAVNNPYTTSWSPSFTSLCKYFSVVSANPIRKP